MVRGSDSEFKQVPRKERGSGRFECMALSLFFYFLFCFPDSSKILRTRLVVGYGRTRVHHEYEYDLVTVSWSILQSTSTVGTYNARRCRKSAGS